jgi:phosphohistidine phosphatase SixA
MNIVIFRHAQKGMLPFENPALSPEGFRQAEALSALVQEHKLPTPTEMWVSEKIRTRQTMQNIANTVRRPVVEKIELDLRQENETQKMFNSRVGVLVDSLSESSKGNAIAECIYICTHYDWIEEAMSLIPSDTDLASYQFAHWGPAQFANFEVKGGLWKFIHKGSPK